MRQLIIGLVVIIALVGIVLATTGVLHFQNTENKTGITIDKQELKDQTNQAVEKTKETGSKLLEGTSQGLHKAGESLKEKQSNDRKEPMKTAPSGTNYNDHTNLNVEP